MRPRYGLREALGCLAIVAILALSTPGVRVARATDGDAGEFERFVRFTAQAESARHASPQAPSCGGSPESRNLAANDRLSKLQRNLVAAIRREVDPRRNPDGIRDLNRRGYNYDTSPAAPQAP